MKLATTNGMPIPVALKEAWRDATVKERNFATPLALYSKRPMQFPAGEREQKYLRGDGPPKNKGDGKGKGKKAPKGAVTVLLQVSASASRQKERSARQRNASLPMFVGMPLRQASDVCLHASDKAGCGRHPGLDIQIGGAT